MTREQRLIRKRARSLQRRHPEATLAQCLRVTESEFALFQGIDWGVKPSWSVTSRFNTLPPEQQQRLRDGDWPSLDDDPHVP